MIVREAHSSIRSDPSAPPFKQHHIAPRAVSPAEPLAPAHLSKAAPEMKTDARYVLRKDSGLKRPDAALLRCLDERFEQSATHSLSPPLFSDVDAHLRDPCVNASAGDRTQRGPPDDPPATIAITTRDQTAFSQMRGAPLLPRWHVSLKGSISGRNPFKVDGAHLLPIVILHCLDAVVHFLSFNSIQAGVSGEGERTRRSSARTYDSKEGNKEYCEFSKRAPGAFALCAAPHALNSLPPLSESSDTTP